MRFTELQHWLEWQESLHSTEIELGLERVGSVFQRLQIGAIAPKVITIAGTNGKGSCAAMLTHILMAAGYRVGTYTSPHIHRYNERICLNNQPVSDDVLCHAFAAVDEVRDSTSITYFEFGSLAAFKIFADSGVDIAILEVGLGGRLDAVNIIEPDVSIITTIDIDHCAWLGNDRESIAKEKAGIMRSGKPVICGDTNPPLTLLNTAKRLQAQLYSINQQFSYAQHGDHWECQLDDKVWLQLPLPVLAGEFQLRNAACVLVALEKLGLSEPIENKYIQYGLSHATLAGRFQVIPGEVSYVFDVAHNAQSATALANLLTLQECGARTHAIVGLLSDKDKKAVFYPFAELIDAWYIANLQVDRSCSTDGIANFLIENNLSNCVDEYASSELAYCALQEKIQKGDRVVVFGSFHVVAQVLEIYENYDDVIA